ncbi:hypothetical protein [Paenibacillus baekrokdamisoli]|uniref:hypothetical protein n=1 Tax=Paenibacillus baekrokdamisoli TaxID=1712516 RepID=UPI001C8648EF|nr:hypothetical protein [Paenibacillus baekrokdamisoli]
MIFVTGCSNSQNISITYLDLKSADGNIQKWIEKNRKMNGIYLGKNITNNEGDIYYLYINYSIPVTKKFSINAVSIDSNSSSSININVRPRPSDQKSEKLFYIKVKESSLKKIILNGEDINTSSIASIQ